ESYLIGQGKSPTDAYLDIEGIIKLAKEKDVDAIHPGYGFLSENITFAKRCEEEGIIFIGPTSDELQLFGDKVRAREAAIKAGLQVIPEAERPVSSNAEVRQFGQTYGCPIMNKALLGGGGRGMRVIRNESDVE